MVVERKRTVELVLGILAIIIIWGTGVESQCSRGCDGLASYYAWNGTNLTFISTVLSTSISDILSYNPQITNQDIIQLGSRINVPFLCDCLKEGFMGHQFIYQVRPGNYYQRIADLIYANLTTVEMLQRFNSYPTNNIPDNAQLNVTVNCSCGNSKVSKDYGLFITYPLRFGENTSSISNEFGLPERLLEDYNPRVNFSSGSALIFVPGKGNFFFCKKSYSFIKQDVC